MERRPETEWQRQMRREENKFIRGSDGHGRRLFGRASCGGGSGRRKGRKQTKQIKTWKHIYKRSHVRRRRTRWDVPQQIRSQRIKRKSQQKIKGERWRRGCRLFTCTQWRSSATLDLVGTWATSLRLEAEGWWVLKRNKHHSGRSALWKFPNKQAGSNISLTGVEKDALTKTEWQSWPWPTVTVSNQVKINRN